MTTHGIISAVLIHVARIDCFRSYENTGLALTLFDLRVEMYMYSNALG